MVEKGATAATTPQLSASWFTGTYAFVVVYAGLLLALAMLLSISHALVTRRTDALARTVVETALAGLAIGSVGAVAALVLAAANGIAQDVVTSMPKDWFATVSGAWGNAGAVAFTLITALLAICVEIVPFVELAVCDAILYVALIFLSATSGGRARAGWCRRSGWRRLAGRVWWWREPFRRVRGQLGRDDVGTGHWRRRRGAWVRVRRDGGFYARRAARRGSDARRDGCGHQQP